MKRHVHSETIKISFVYCIVFMLWIFFRDRIFLPFGASKITYTFNQIIIDVGFAFVTTLSIYFLSKYYKSIILKEENLFKQIINNSNALIFVKRNDNKYVLINNQFEKLFHISNKSIKDTTGSELWPHEVLEKFAEFDKKVFDTGKPLTLEETIPHNDGPHTYVTVKFPIRDIFGRTWAVGGIATDITEFKQIAIELEHSLAFSRATLESTTDGILVVTKDGEMITGFNQNFVRMWNIPLELINTKIDKYVLEYVTAQLENPKEFLSKVIELYNNPEKESFDVLELADGRIFERYSKPQISKNEIIGRVWSFRDVTSKKLMEEEDKKRISQTLSLQEAILKLTHIDIELSLDKKFEKILEVTSKAMGVERVSLWFYNDNRNSIITEKIYNASIDQYSEGMELKSIDYPKYFKALEVLPLIVANDVVQDSRTEEFVDNYLKPLGITSMMDTPIRIGGRIIGIICHEHIGTPKVWSYQEQVFSSSTAALIAASIEHEARSKSEEKYRFLAEIVPQIFWTANSEGALDYFNNNTYTYTGKTFEDLKGLGWHSIIHPDDIHKTISNYLECIKTGVGLELEYRIRKYDGEYRWHLSRAVPQKDLEGNIIKWFGTNTDIHLQKSLVEELKYMNYDLSRTNKDLDNFIYTASHDLKAPIANIEGLLNSLMDSIPQEFIDDRDNSITFDLMRESIEKFKKVIKDLTEISQVQKNDGSQIEECYFSEIVDEIKISISPLIKSVNAKFFIDFDNVPSIIYGKRNLRSILYNLISNAIKYRSSNRESIIYLKTEAIENYILLTVKDNGIGMKPDILSKIFRMFKRYHTHVDGSGIGLYIVKRIIENSGGNIEVESQEGVGSTFKVYLKV